MAQVGKESASPAVQHLFLVGDPMLWAGAPTSPRSSRGYGHLPLHPNWALRASGFQRALHLSLILLKKIRNEGIYAAQPSVGIWHAAPMGEHLNLQLLFCFAPARPEWMSTRDSDADQGRLVLSPVPTATLDILALTGSVHGLREPRFSHNQFPATPLRMESLPCCWTGQGRAGSG